MAKPRDKVSPAVLHIIQSGVGFPDALIQSARRRPTWRTGPDEVRPGVPEGMRAPFGRFAANAAQAAVAVIADHFWQAQTALDVLPVEWDDGEGAQWTTTQMIYDALAEQLTNPVEPNIVFSQGDAAGMVAAETTIEADYLTPYMDHVNMEPLNGTALVTADRVDCRLPHQHPQQALFVIADETGVDPHNVHVHQTWIGTGLGRRVFGDDARMVAAVAKAMPGTPVKVNWSAKNRCVKAATAKSSRARSRPKSVPTGCPRR